MLAIIDQWNGKGKDKEKQNHAEDKQLLVNSLIWKTWNGPGISAVRGPHSTTWNTISWTQQNYL